MCERHNIRYNNEQNAVFKPTKSQDVIESTLILCIENCRTIAYRFLIFGRVMVFSYRVKIEFNTLSTLHFNARNGHCLRVSH